MGKRQEIIAELSASGDVRFSRLLAVCEVYFGKPRIRGSHHVFKMPWSGDPRINLQEDKGGVAKNYQVRQVIRALQRLEEESHEE
jgi:hypothetical protein